MNAWTLALLLYVPFLALAARIVLKTLGLVQLIIKLLSKDL